MSVEFKCPQCGRRFAASVSLKQKQRDAILCPGCGAAASSSLSVAPKPQPKPDTGGKKDHPLLLVRHKPEEDLIDMTAMVDIVFFLLIFFMVTSIQSLQAVMNMPPPQSNEPASAQVVEMVDPTFINVTIEEDDTMWVEDEEIHGGAALRTKLRKMIADNPSLTGLIVTGHPDASHGTLVLILDCGTDVGIEELKFSMEAGEG